MTKEYLAVCIDDDEQFLASMATSLPARVQALCPDFQCVFEFVSGADELFDMLAEEETAAALGLVISDQMMAGLSGIELLEKLKGKHPDIVSVLLTGHAGLDSAKYAINHHLLDQYVAKPIEDLEEFASIAANLLKKHHLDLEERTRTVELAATVEQLRVSNEKIKLMQAAAEQVAMLPKGLKSLDFNEVVALVTREVPRIFEAEWGVLCFPHEGSCQPEAPLICRHDCPADEQLLIAREDLAQACRESAVFFGDVPPSCRDRGACSPEVILPLAVPCADNARETDGPASLGYLCLCRLSPEARGRQDLLRYSGMLLREVLSANLTNAKLYQMARHDSEIDPLTGAHTRRVLEEKLEDEYERTRRYRHPFCVAILDVDHFKDVNDRFGHSAGDEALRQLTGVLRGNMRAPDVLGRYGGDEFVLLMPETELEQGMAAAERIRRQVVEALSAHGRTLTISSGVAQWTEADECGADILRRADAALYEAKRSGRDCVRSAQAA